MPLLCMVRAVQTGVILVTTKEGSPDKISVNIRLNYHPQVIQNLLILPTLLLT